MTGTTDAQAAITTLSAAAAVSGATTAGTAAFTALQVAAATAAALIAGDQAAAETVIKALSPSISGAAAAIQWLGSASTQTANLAQSTAAGGYVGRIVINLAQEAT